MCGMGGVCARVCATTAATTVPPQVLGSNHVVKFFDAFSEVELGRVGIVMEYLGGGSLEDLVKAGGCQDEANLANICAQVLKVPWWGGGPGLGALLPTPCMFGCCGWWWRVGGRMRGSPPPPLRPSTHPLIVCVSCLRKGPPSTSAVLTGFVMSHPFTSLRF